MNALELINFGSSLLKEKKMKRDLATGEVKLVQVIDLKE
jgi:hypothetical protein